MFQVGNNPMNSAEIPLTLRVRGGPRDGQVVRLTEAKCTIGSSRACTLRLLGKDVRPVHCLIVRGKAQTVVRRWSADTLLNGESFDDKQLLLGDRLRCGPVEFEVVTASGEPCAKPSPASQVEHADLSGTQVLPAPPGIAPPPVGTQVLPSLDGSMTVAMPRPLHAPSAAHDIHATVAIQPVAKPTNVATEHGATERDAEFAKREAELAERERKLADTMRQTDDRDRALLGRESDLARQEADLQEREERLARREQELAAQAATAAPTESPDRATAEPSVDRGEFAAIDEARQKLADEREALAKAQREAAAQHAMREAEHKRWQEDHRQWKSQRKAAEDQMEGLHAQVEHQLAEIMARRKNLDQDRDAWKSESETNRRLLEERTAEVARQAEEVEHSRKELEAQRQKAAKLLEETSRYEQLRAELSDARQTLSTRDEELAAARREIAAARQEVAQVAAAAETDYREKLAQLEQQAEELLRIRTQLERERAEWDAQARSAAPSELTGVALRRASEVEEAPPTRTRASDAPSNLSTWELLKDRIDVADDEPEDRPQPRTAAAASPPGHHEPHGEDADSIEHYMASLMQRVGGRTTSSEPATARPASDREAAAQSVQSPRPDASAIAPASEARRPATVVRKPQKTVTPEEVAAMRELANLNTRVAITRHGARQMVPNIFAKATMGVVAWALAATVYLVSPTRGVLALAGASACALVGAMLLARTLTDAAKLFASRRTLPDEAGAQHASPRNT